MHSPCTALSFCNAKYIALTITVSASNTGSVTEMWHQNRNWYQNRVFPDLDQEPVVLSLFLPACLGFCTCSCHRSPLSFVGQCSFLWGDYFISPYGAVYDDLLKVIIHRKLTQRLFTLTKKLLSLIKMQCTQGHILSIDVTHIRL